MATFRLPGRRLALVGACSVALAAAPAALVLAGSIPSPHALADQCGGINWNVMSEGAPVASNCAGATPGPITAGAPSQQTLTNCSGIPGCLSNALYGPGNVQVPRPNTTVQQSQ
ncbi:MAG: hypothetical protein JO044_15070 [Mycobacteriaceae bacterium]|nr:hypothetical protein [Mycobacteriaceae bacterium]MBV9641139.1 hypothetical protein [Mycobacteriaceae bacterium]